MKTLRLWPAVIAIVACGSASCSLIWPEEPANTDSTFLAHSDSGGLIIEKMEGGLAGKVVRAAAGPLQQGPQLLVETSTGTIATLWVQDPDIIVRSTDNASAPPIGRVDASFDDGAIQLMLIAESEGAYHTSTFGRTDGGAAPAALGQSANLTVNLSGEYTAIVSDAQGAQVGWLRARVGGSWSTANRYEGKLPAPINGPIAVAAVARLEKSINSMRSSSPDPHLGN